MVGPDQPCGPWIDAADLCCTIPEGTPDALVESAIEAATGFLYDRTCRRWPGVCTVEIRPCPPPCSCGLGRWGVWGWYPYADGSYAWGWGNGCRCTWNRYELPGAYPAIELIAYTVDGVDHTADVRLDNARYLTLLDTGGSCFPRQDMGLDNGEPGTWSVAYTFGVEAPAYAQRAVGDLACELLKGCVGEDCALPDATSSVSKRGTTITFRGPEYTNVKTADQLIATYACPEGGTARMLDPTERMPVVVAPILGG